VPPGEPGTNAPLFWRAAVADAVLRVDAIPADAGHPDALDIGRTGIEALLLSRSDGAERLLLREGARSIRIDVRSGTLHQGPVRLRYALDGLARLDAQLLTLRRLSALWRLGRMPAELFPPETRARRWIDLLRTIDARTAGASHRDIAQALFSRAQMRDGWRSESDYLRMRVQRLVRSGRALVGGDYLALLRSRHARAASLGGDRGIA